MLGESAQAAESALREAESRNYNSRGLLEASKDESQSVGRSISAQLPSYRRALHDLACSILQECRPDVPPRQGRYSDWRRECADIAAAHEDIVQFSLNRSLAQTADFNPLRRGTGVASGFEKVIASMGKHPLLVQISQELGPQLQGEGGEGVDEATAQQRLQEFFKRKMSDPVAQHELQAVSRDFVRSISQTLNEFRRVELSGRLLTIIGGVEERVAHEFLTRALDRYASGWRMLHLHATDYFARFCGYKPKVLA